MPRHCHVVHRLPGRIRLKTPAAKGDHAFFARLRGGISALDGVHAVEANPVTGSVVVHYDKNDRAIEERLEQAFQDENTLLSMVLPQMQDVERITRFVESDVAILAKRSRIGAALMHAIKAFNLHIKRASGNTVDLQLLLPLAFAGSSLYFAGGKRDPLLWIMLLYISFHTFVTLHQPVMPSPQNIGPAAPA